jgi:hypothetical protein
MKYNMFFANELLAAVKTFIEAGMAVLFLTIVSIYIFS